MWQRRDLKYQARSAFRENYWRCVAVAVILMVVPRLLNGTFLFRILREDVRPNVGDGRMVGEAVQEMLRWWNGAASEIQMKIVLWVFAWVLAMAFLMIVLSNILPAAVMTILVVNFAILFSWNSGVGIAGGIAWTFGVSAAITLLVSIADLKAIFLLNPLKVGKCGFFTENGSQPASLKELLRGVRGEVFLKNLKIMFLRDLFIGLWSVLIIPGAIKSYEYRMVPYLLADRPELTRKEIFAESRRMMQGNKMRAFMLDLSFVGWQFLSMLTGGLANIFYVAPYMMQTDAELYRTLRDTPAEAEY